MNIDNSCVTLQLLKVWLIVIQLFLLDLIHFSVGTNDIIMLLMQGVAVIYNCDFFTITYGFRLWYSARSKYIVALCNPRVVVYEVLRTLSSDERLQYRVVPMNPRFCCDNSLANRKLYFNLPEPSLWLTMYGPACFHGRALPDVYGV